MRRLISALATAACTAGLTLLPAATAQAAPTGCVYSDSSAIHPADPAAPISVTYPEGTISPEGQVCHQGSWEGAAVDDGSYDEEPDC